MTPSTNTVSVSVNDRRAAEAFELVLDANDALDVFSHPYAYAAWRGLEFPVPEAQRNARAPHQRVTTAGKAST